MAARMRIGMARRWAALALALAVAALLGGNAALAQDQSIPPWPILFQGTALLNGEPVQEGTLTVRVGDWESPIPVPVRDGVFDCGAACLIRGAAVARLPRPAGNVPSRWRVAGDAVVHVSVPGDAVPGGGRAAVRRRRRACADGEPVPVGRRAASHAHAYAHATPGNPDANRSANANPNVCARAHSGACGRTNRHANPCACAHGRIVVRRELRHADSYPRRSRCRHRGAGHRRHKARAQTSVEGRSLLR